MKDEIKLLYSKDKKLAIKVAKALGYKIKAVENLGPAIIDHKSKKIMLLNRSSIWKNWMPKLKAIYKAIENYKSIGMEDDMSPYMYSHFEKKGYKLVKNMSLNLTLK